jgi:hypothetical protein
MIFIIKQPQDQNTLLNEKSYHHFQVKKKLVDGIKIANGMVMISQEHGVFLTSLSGPRIYLASIWDLRVRKIQN